MARREHAATVILDCEAIQALADPNHRKHRRSVSFMQVANDRRRRRAGAPKVIVPVAARVEAGWLRSDPSAADLNRLTRFVDWQLTSERADRATQLRTTLAISVVDATIAQAAEECPTPVTIVTSDVEDITRVADALDGEVRVARL